MLSKPTTFEQAQEVVHKHGLVIIEILNSHYELNQRIHKTFTLYPLFFITKPIYHWVHKDFRPLTDIADTVKTSARLIEQLETAKESFIADYAEVMNAINKHYPSKNTKGEDCGTRTRNAFLDTFNSVYNELKTADEKYQSWMSYVEGMISIMNGIDPITRNRL